MGTSTADGLYAMSVGDDLGTRLLGGPFADIDDVLDCCFDELMATDRGVDSVFYVVVSGGEVAIRAFPAGAFPLDAELSQD